MHYAVSSILVLAASSFPATMGAPHPQIICDTGVSYQVTSQQDTPGTAMTGDYSVSGASGREYHPNPPAPREKKTN